MRIAFVGVKRDYTALDPSYVRHFDQYHLELPFYFARDGHNQVVITTTNYSDFPMGGDTFGPQRGTLSHVTESEFQAWDVEFDVVIHWRKWFPELYRPGAINVINCQDHSFSQEWKQSVVEAYTSGKLYGILCFPTWHQANLHDELQGAIPMHRLIAGLTLGVDTEVYTPSIEKDPRMLLWASDPGRGLHRAVELAIRLWAQADKAYRLHVCYPDYVPPQTPIRHPAIEWHGCVSNGPNLWKLFNMSTFLPYTSVFKEPSSRAHRQAQAAGCVVLYPPDMGSPSYLIRDGIDGVVSDPSTWFETIVGMSPARVANMCQAARARAIDESWEVQAGRFNETIQRIVAEKRS